MWNGLIVRRYMGWIAQLIQLLADGLLASLFWGRLTERRSLTRIAHCHVFSRYSTPLPLPHHWSPTSFALCLRGDGRGFADIKYDHICLNSSIFCSRIIIKLQHKQENNIGKYLDAWNCKLCCSREIIRIFLHRKNVDINNSWTNKQSHVNSGRSRIEPLHCSIREIMQSSNLLFPTQ